MTAILSGIANAALVMDVSIGVVVTGAVLSGDVVFPVVLLAQKPSVDPLHARIIDFVQSTHIPHLSPDSWQAHILETKIHWLPESWLHS